MRNIILIAPPAAGKGTQSELISSKYNIPHISTGDLLRHEIIVQSELGLSIKKALDDGNFASDDSVIHLLEERITQADCANGYILDGFPRNIYQAEKYLKLLDKLNYPIGDVIYLDISADVAKRRIIGRISCFNCGAVYNNQIEDSKPLNLSACDKCGGSLIRRDDDNEKTFEQRFKVYIEQTQPLIDFFASKGLLFTVNSGINSKETFLQIENILNRGQL